MDVYNELKNRLFNQRQGTIAFKKLKRIGKEGVNSLVYRAIDAQLNSEIAIKEIPLKMFENEDEYFEEARVFYESAHPNVVSLKYATKDDKSVYIAMPYYRNGSVAALMNRQYLTLREILTLSFDFLTGLNFIHSKGMVHLDIKPGNIMLSDSGRALLSDFGLARYVSNTRVHQPDSYYAIHMPPETFEKGKHIDVRVDIYQVGILLYRMVNGNAVLKQQYKQHALGTNGKYDLEKYRQAVREGKYPDRRLYLPHVPRKMRRIINRAINPDPNQRYGSVMEILNDLARVTEQLDIQYDVYNAVPPRQQWRIPIKHEVHTFELVHHRDGACSLRAYKKNWKNKLITVLDKKDYHQDNIARNQAFQNLQLIFLRDYS